GNDRGFGDGLPICAASFGDAACSLDRGHDRQFDQYRFVTDGPAVETSPLASCRCRPLEEVFASPLRLSPGLCGGCLRCLRAGRLGLGLPGGAVGRGIHLLSSCRVNAVISWPCASLTEPPPRSQDRKNAAAPAARKA